MGCESGGAEVSYCDPGEGDGGWLLMMGRYTVAGTTVWSGLSYLYTKGSVRIIKHPETVPEKAMKELEAAEKRAVEEGEKKMKL